jgi:hypothetical protein
MDVILGWIEMLGGTLLLIGIVYFCAKKVAEMAVAKVFEDYKADLSFDAKMREKAALVAKLLSEWIRKPMDPVQVNRLLWEASMWLPDQEVKDLNRLLLNAGEKSTKDVIVAIRNVIQGKGTTVLASDITHFPS